jgi:hypothetical protein
MPDDLEVIKAVAQGTAAGATEWLQKVVLNLLGRATEEIGEEFLTSVRRWRARRALELSRRVLERLEVAGHPRRPIRMSVLLPSLEYASVEDRNELHDWWVELLTTAGTDGAAEVERVYVEILKDLTPIDARLLHWIRDRPPELDRNDPATALQGGAYSGPLREFQLRPRAEKASVLVAFSMSEPEFDLMASRLERLGLCDVGRFVFPTRSGTSGTGPRMYDSIALRPLGIAFVDACRPR